jgi:hypothetical protein
MHTEFWWQAYEQVSTWKADRNWDLICDGDRLMELAQNHIERQAVVL